MTGSRQGPPCRRPDLEASWRAVGLKTASADIAGERVQRLIVVAASVLANALADDQADGRLARDHLASGRDLVAPDLVDVETVSVLRRRWLAGDITARRFLRRSTTSKISRSRDSRPCR